MVKYFRFLFLFPFFIPFQGISQHVGINVDTPAVELDIRSIDPYEASQINLGNLNNAHLLRLYSGSEDDPSPVIFWNANDPLRLGNGTADIEFFERIRITADGRIGIGTDPDSSAQLQVESTSKGVIFPRMTTMQRDEISNPSNGLHIFNTESQCLEYYDAYIEEWNCYCLECRTKIITITDNVCEVDFFTTYANSFSVPQKYVIIIPDTVLVSACYQGENALDFSGLPVGSQVTIVNHGSIVGGGGNGGNRGIRNNCNGLFSASPQDGMNGGHAIVTSVGVSIHVENHGLVAGAGGGGAGGGGDGTCNNYFGGGGGGGAGHPRGYGGNGYFDPIGTADGCSCYWHESNSGSEGSNITDLDSPDFGGVGGNGVRFTGTCSSDGSEVGAVGGTGGSLGNPGGESTLCSTIWAVGGDPGKAISGGSGNVITNLGSGMTFGVID